MKTIYLRLKAHEGSKPTTITFLDGSVLKGTLPEVHPEYVMISGNGIVAMVPMTSILLVQFV